MHMYIHVYVTCSDMCIIVHHLDCDVTGSTVWLRKGTRISTSTGVTMVIHCTMWCFL